EGGGIGLGERDPATFGNLLLDRVGHRLARHGPFRGLVPGGREVRRRPPGHGEDGLSLGELGERRCRDALHAPSLPAATRLRGGPGPIGIASPSPANALHTYTVVAKVASAVAASSGNGAWNLSATWKSLWPPRSTRTSSAGCVATCSPW